MTDELESFLISQGVTQKHLSLARGWIISQSNLSGGSKRTRVDGIDIEIAGASTVVVNGHAFDFSYYFPEFEYYTDAGNPAGEIIKESQFDIDTAETPPKSSTIIFSIVMLVAGILLLSKR